MTFSERERNHSQWVIISFPSIEFHGWIVAHFTISCYCRNLENKSSQWRAIHHQKEIYVYTFITLIQQLVYCLITMWPSYLKWLYLDSLDPFTLIFTHYVGFFYTLLTSIWGLQVLETWQTLGLISNQFVAPVQLSGNEAWAWHLSIRMGNKL